MPILALSTLCRMNRGSHRGDDVSGVKGGTNGLHQKASLIDRRHSLGFGAWALISALLFGSSLVSITSTLSEPSAGRQAQDWEIVLWSLSSASVLALLAPAFFQAYSRFPLRRHRTLAFIGLQAALLILFALAHVLGMVAIRKLAYWLAGHTYDFTGGQPLDVFFYELRKDAFTYVTFLLFYSVCFVRKEAQSRPVEPQHTPLEIKWGGRRVYLSPASILYVESAGNYVEIHTIDRSYLLRDTLTRYEARLSVHGFVRIHRAIVVNPSRVTEVHAEGSGALKVRLSNGVTLSASRRQKAHLLDVVATARMASSDRE